MLRFETESGLNAVYGKALQAEGIAYVIDNGEQLTNLELPDPETAYIPIVTNETRLDNKKFRDLTPSAVAVLAQASGFLTLGRALRCDPSHISTVLRSFDDREDFIGVACWLDEYSGWDIERVMELQNTLRGWNGQHVRLLRTDDSVVLERSLTD